MAGKRQKPTYSFFDNVGYILRALWKWKSRTVCLFARAPFMVLSSFLGIYLSKEVVADVTQSTAPKVIFLHIGSISLALAVSLLLQKALSAKLQEFMMLFDISTQMRLLEKRITGDYENMESSDGLTRISKAAENAGSDDRGARQIANVLSSFTANMIGAVSYAVLLIRLSPWILFVVAATTLAGFWILKAAAAWNYRNKDSWKIYDRKLDYLGENAGDFTKAKDIRLYGLSDWFRDIFTQTLAERMRWHKKEQFCNFRADGLRALLSLLRDGISYTFLVYLLFARHLPVSDFVLYFGLIGGFAAWLDGIVEDFHNLIRFHLGFCEMREFLDYPDRANHGSGISLPRETFCIEFRGVCYRYPGNREDTIRDLSFAIHKGEKLAVVGPNGAGKTTLVKLLCGLYAPTDGMILIDGHPIDAYNREEYYTLFSAVFQDVFILPLSVARNVSAATEEETQREKVNDALAMAGLSQKVGELAKGTETKLIKSVDDGAVDFSGGELQKLALARALYKDGKALILDEPTAALDPIAESRVYQQYEQMARGRTCVFISHRLASTRFCDRIFYLENGRIAECGSHEELMAKRGKYAGMFEVQSRYYRKAAVDDGD